MGLNQAERNLIVIALHNHVEEAYDRWQTRREFLDHLIERYKEAGLDGFGPGERVDFLGLVEEAL